MVAEIRTLSSPAAQDAVKQMNSILTSNLAGDLARLRSQGQRLSEPNVWDGRNASQFRASVWPQTDDALRKLQGELDVLRTKIDAITANIMSAG